MTQDAVPQDQYLIEKLMEPFQDSKSEQVMQGNCRIKTAGWWNAIREA